MIRKLTLAVGFGAGYVLGAKAGTQRYEQIMQKVDELMGKPQVQQATAAVQQTASDLADTAKSTVNDKVEQVTSSGGGKGDQDVVVDLGTSGHGADTGATMAGAAASNTAPDLPR